ncbi:glycosyltransferase [Spirillospora sp. NPDC047279]|uniref:glycosyltransferase n=1 Tax=Spirillospora sp. NPDC047279 TaxID=3155478 RepID=UPI00340260E7
MNGPYVVLPGGAVPSGGNVYDREVLRRMPAAVDIVVPGRWPRPDATVRGRLAEALDGLPDDAVVLMDGLVACGVPEIVVPRARRLTLAVLVHLPLGDETGAPDGLIDCEGETLRAVSAVVTTSRWAARRVTELHGLPAGRVHVVPPGVDPAPEAPGTENGARLLCVASLTPRKGHDVLIEALASVGDLAWDCLCAGPATADPEHAEWLRKLIEHHGLDRRIRLAGPYAGAELDAAYAEADLLVLPSRAETYGMVVTEALARGVPVLASDVGGVPEAIGGDAGLLVPPGDAGALAAALRRWLGDAGLRRRLRSAARDRRGTLGGWDETAVGVTAVLDRLAERFSPGWLALREEADAAARAELVPPDLRRGAGDLVVHDIGCGTGSMARWLSERLDGPRRWVLHDRDADLLDQARRSVPADAETRQGEIADLSAADFAGASLVTASALLDLLTRDELTALVDAIAGAGCPALLTLSVTGRVELFPADPLDADFQEAFNGHQRRDGRLGPDAVAAAVEEFERHGLAVRVRTSPWRLGPEHAALTERWLRGWVAAACEQRPDLARRAETYLRDRTGTCAAGDLRAVVHHADLLVEPR